MREPEAGSEFAIGAATAGETRLPGFGVTMCHPRGTGRIWTESKITFPFFPPQSSTPSKVVAAPRLRKAPGSEGLTPLSEPGGLYYWGGALGVAGNAGNTFKVERSVWRMPWVGRRPGSQRGCETFVICLVSLNGSASL